MLTVHVVMTPGIYSLEDSLKLGTEGQVLLGLGMATLVPAKGTAAVEVGDVDGVRVAVSSQSAVVCLFGYFDASLATTGVAHRRRTGADGHAPLVGD